MIQVLDVTREFNKKRKVEVYVHSLFFTKFLFRGAFLGNINLKGRITLHIPRIAVLRLTEDTDEAAVLELYPSLTTNCLKLTRMIYSNITIIQWDLKIINI